MRRLTRKQAIAKFRKHWRWVAAEPGRRKEDYPHLPDDMKDLAACFLCEYASQNPGEGCLECCLIKWPDKDCCSPRSPFLKYNAAISGGNVNKAQKYASQIAELPENVTTSSK